MMFDPPLQSARLIRRYKRFLADVELDSGETMTLHCPNTGSMRACLAPGERVWFSTSDNPKRKYPHTWEIATTPSGHLAGINTNLSNRLIEQALQDKVIQPLMGYETHRREVRYGAENSRIDFLLSDHPHDVRPCYLEVKNVTLMEAEGQGLFPDAVSARGTKHLRELIAMVNTGARAVLVFCVQHTGIDWVEAAKDIDPDYANTLSSAMAAGVEVMAYKATVNPEDTDTPIRITQAIPVKNSVG